MSRFDNFLPLPEVKNYLRVDCDFKDDDEAIERMRDSALSFIEKRTNHIFGRHHREYSRRMKVCGCGLEDYIEIYDYPIRLNPGINALQYSDKVRIYSHLPISADVGYELRDEVPSELLDAALQLIKVWYFEAEKEANTTSIPESVAQVINAYRRFTAL